MRSRLGARPATWSGDDDCDAFRFDAVVIDDEDPKPLTRSFEVSLHMRFDVSVHMRSRLHASIVS